MIHATEQATCSMLDIVHNTSTVQALFKDLGGVVHRTPQVHLSLLPCVFSAYCLSFACQSHRLYTEGLNLILKMHCVEWNRMELLLILLLQLKERIKCIEDCPNG